MAHIDNDTFNEWAMSDQTNKVVFPTEKCTEGCSGKFGFCCTHQEAHLDNNDNIIIRGPTGRTLLVITRSWNPLIRLCEWKNKQGATLSRGHRDYGFTYGKHITRQGHACAVEVGNNQKEELFGFQVGCYVAGYGGQPYKY